MKDSIGYENIKALEELIKRAKLEYEVESDISTAIKVSLTTPLIIKMINEGVFETYVDNIGVMSLTEMDHFSSEFFKLLIFMKSSLKSRKIPLKSTNTPLKSTRLSNDGIDETNIYVDGVKVKSIKDKSIKDKHKAKADLSKLAALAALFNDPAFTNFINEEEDEEED